MQQCSAFTHFGKAGGHIDHQDAQQHQPCEGKSVGSGIEENQRPQEIDCQLGKEARSDFGILTWGALLGDKSHPGAHQGEKNRPYDGEEESRGRKRGLDNALRIALHPCPTEQTGCDPYPLA